MNTKTKTILSAATAATLFLAAPLAAFADGRDHGYRGWGPQPYSSHPGKGWKHGHYKPGYAYGSAHVQPYYYPAPRVYYPAPRVVAPPVYVPVPAPVIAVPAPYPYPQYPGNSVNIGFRLFF